MLIKEFNIFNAFWDTLDCHNNLDNGGILAQLIKKSSKANVVEPT